jgi:hypothetical protein
MEVGKSKWFGGLYTQSPNPTIEGQDLAPLLTKAQRKRIQAVQASTSPVASGSGRTLAIGRTRIVKIKGHYRRYLWARACTWDMAEGFRLDSRRAKARACDARLSRTLVSLLIP